MPIPARRLATALASVLLAAAALAAREGRSAVDVGGEPREYLLHLPDDDTRGPLPLVLVFHGGGGRAEGIRGVTGLDAAADRHGFAVAYPDAGDGTWGTIRPTTGDPADDVAFVEALVRRLVAEHDVDPTRVYATGLSNGGEFALLLGLTRPDLVAAVAPVGMAMSEAVSRDVEPVWPIPVMNIVGDADRLVPYEGGTIGRSRDRVLSSDETLSELRRLNGLGDASGTSEMIDDVDPDDGTRVRVETWADGAASVVRVTVEGGGHTWPGGRQYLPERIIGRTSRDVDANELIWAFFEGRSTRWTLMD